MDGNDRRTTILGCLLADIFGTHDWSDLPSSSLSSAKKDEGFGEGNFKALFESIERDQIARGVISADEESSGGKQ